MYPYTAGGTGLAASLPLWVQEGGREKMIERLKDPAVRARARKEIETTIDGWENLILGIGLRRHSDRERPADRRPVRARQADHRDREGAQTGSVGHVLRAAARDRRPRRRALSHDERSRT